MNGPASRRPASAKATPAAVAAEVETRLKARGGRRRGDELTALCPFHDDTTPSLDWNGAKQVFVCRSCGAKGGWKKLAEALGIEVAAGRGAQRRPVATYDYTDAAGELLFQVLRFEPKDFRQRRPDGNGGWRWNLDGVQRVPYRLRDLGRARNAGERVFVVEGEKDADRLASLGLIATTTPMGAGAWRASYAEHFRGCDVVVIPDADEPGLRHADQVAAGLSRVARSVSLLELPDPTAKGADVSDFLDGSGSLEQLLALADEIRLRPRAGPVSGGAHHQRRPCATFHADAREEGDPPVAGPTSTKVGNSSDIEPLPFPTFTARQVRTLPPVPMRIADISLPLRGLAAIAGASGHGKGLLTMEVGHAIARGTPLRGDLPVEQAPVAFIVAEGWSGIPARQRAVEMHHQVADDEDVQITYVAAAPQLDDPTAADQVAATLRQLDPRPRVLFVDTYRATHSGDENDSRDVALYVRSLQILSGVIDGLVVIIVHAPWNADRERGSTALRAAMDWVALVQKEDDIVTMSCLKAKDGPEFKPLRWRIEAWADSATVVPIGEKEQDRPTPRRWPDLPRNAQQVLLALRDFGETAAPSGQLQKAARVPESSFHRTVNHLSQWGFATRTKARLVLLTDEGKALLP